MSFLKDQRDRNLARKNSRLWAAGAGGRTGLVAPIGSGVRQGGGGRPSLDGQNIVAADPRPVDRLGATVGLIAAQQEIPGDGALIEWEAFGSRTARAGFAELALPTTDVPIPLAGAYWTARVDLSWAVDPTYGGGGRVNVFGDGEIVSGEGGPAGRRYYDVAQLGVLPVGAPVQVEVIPNGSDPRTLASALLHLELVDLVTGSSRNPPLDLMFVTDVSGSMSDNDPDAIRVSGAIGFLEEMRDSDFAGVVSFAASATLHVGLLPVLTERETIETGIEATASTSGGTNIGAGVGAALDELVGSGAGNARAILLLTDGQDSTLVAEVVDACVAADTTLYAIGLGSGVDSAKLQGMADGTGGLYVFAETADDIASVYDLLAVELL